MPEAALEEKKWWENATGDKDVFSQHAILNHQFVVCQSRGSSLRCESRYLLVVGHDNACRRNLRPIICHAMRLGWTRNTHKVFNIRALNVAEEICCHHTHQSAREDQRFHRHLGRRENMWRTHLFAHLRTTAARLSEWSATCAPRANVPDVCRTSSRHRTLETDGWSEQAKEHVAW